MRRIAQLAGYTLIVIGIVRLTVWTFSGARPALDCGLVGAVAMQDWGAAYACLDNSRTNPLVTLGGVSGLLLVLLYARRTPRGKKAKIYSPTPEERQSNRKILIGRVSELCDYSRRLWLPQEVLLYLGVEWDAPRSSPALGLAAGPQLATFYEQMNHQLLILGAPGSGKTTVLIDLARSFLDRCKVDASIPIPVVLVLSSWVEAETRFEDWLVSEMRLLYQNDISTEVVNYWLEHNEIALFFDGLDELPEERRSNAVMAIEAYRKSALGRWLVVTSRSAEYAALVGGFTNLGIVEIKPVSPAQIQGYLAELDGEQPRQLASVIASDKTLQEVASTPLMLNLMLWVSEVVDLPTLVGDKDTQRVRESLYDYYLFRALLNQDASADYSTKNTLGWLHWLAVQMKGHEQTVFLLERLNRSWLNYRWQRHVWFVLLIAAVGLASGLLAGAIAAVIATALWDIVYGIAVLIVVGITCTVLAAVIYALNFAFNDKVPRERLRLKWNPRKIRDVLLWTVGLTFLMILFFPIMFLFWREPFPSWRWDSLLELFVMAFIVVFLGNLSDMVFGLSSALDESPHGVQPGDGIKHSMRNGAVVMLFGATSAFLLLSLIVFASLFRWMSPADVWNDLRSAEEMDWVSIFNLAMCFSFAFGLHDGMKFGWDTVAKHYILRLFLWLDGSMPRTYVSFLDYCERRVLLRRVGGTYMFVHATIRDHFASLTPENIGELTQAVERVRARQRELRSQDG